MHEPIEEKLNKHRLPPQTESDRKATREKLKRGKVAQEFGQGQIIDRQFQQHRVQK